MPFGVVWPPLLKRLRRRISKAWVRGVPVLLGTRITVRGQKPEAPFFLVGNHLSWIDFFVTHTLVDAVSVSESVVNSIPVLGSLLRGLDLIIVHRVRRAKEELTRTNERIMEAMREGLSIVLAPEATESPGRRVCHFHSALLEPAVRMQRPVHYASLAVRTPDGWPPPSYAGLPPNPGFHSPHAASSETEGRSWGPDCGVIRYVVGLLSLPWHEYTVTFAKEPILGTDRKTLAKDLQKAVQSIFTPVA
jgi:1-acyl-sn-glycerol-3-phosphate acyltransferase